MPTHTRLAVLLCVLVTAALGGQQADDPGHAVRQAAVGVLFGDVYTVPAVPGQWVEAREERREVRREMHWLYCSGRRVLLRSGDARYWVTVDDGAERLAGIDFGMPDGDALLRDAIAAGARDLVVACWHDAVGRLPVLPAGRGFALLVQGKGMADLSPLSRQTGLDALRIAACEDVTDLRPLAALTALTSLSLGECTKLADLRPLAALTRLATAELTGLPNGLDLAPLGELPALRSLLVSCEQIGAAAAVTQLHYLNYSHTGGGRVVIDLAPLRRMGQLRALGLTSCHRMTGIEPLADLPDLTWVTLHECGGFESYAPLVHLTELRVLRMHVCDNLRNLSFLAALVHLEELSLTAGDEVIGGAALPQARSLKRLRLACGPRLTDLSPLRGLTQLETLDIGGAGVRTLAPLAGLGKLTELSITGCRGVTDLAPLARLTGLTRLEMRGVNRVRDLSPLADLAELRVLNIGRCDAVTDLAPLANLKKLEELDLLMMRGVTDFSPLAELPNLRRVRIYGSRGLQSLEPLRGVVRRGGFIKCDSRQEAAVRALGETEF